MRYPGLITMVVGIVPQDMPGDDSVGSKVNVLNPRQ